MQEAMLVMQSNVDMLDLKEPNNGALGALDLALSASIVRQIKEVNGENYNSQLISATVGEHFDNLQAMMLAIKQRADIDVDIIKIAVSDFFYLPDFVAEMAKLSRLGINIVAVFFAESAIDFSLLPKLQQAGFYGAMLDTQFKQVDLLSLQTTTDLQLFTQYCHQHRLMCGLAGSLKPQHIDTLLKMNATYIGFRGGVCDKFDRTNGLNLAKMQKVQNMLRNGNKNIIKPQLILRLALHS